MGRQVFVCAWHSEALFCIWDLVACRFRVSATCVTGQLFSWCISRSVRFFFLPRRGRYGTLLMQQLSMPHDRAGLSTVQSGAVSSTAPGFFRILRTPHSTEPQKFGKK